MSIKKFRVETIGLKNYRGKTTETDLACVKFDGDAFNPSQNWIQVFYDESIEPKIMITKNGNRIFDGSYDELCQVILSNHKNLQERREGLQT